MSSWLRTCQPIILQLPVHAVGFIVFNIKKRKKKLLRDTTEDSKITGGFLDELPNFEIDFFSAEEKAEHPGRFVDVLTETLKS